MPPARKSRKPPARASARAPRKSPFEKKLAGIIEDFVRRSRTASTPRRVPRTLKQATQEFQRGILLESLEAHRKGDRWNIAATAKELDVARSFIYSFLEQLGIRTRFALQR